MKPTTTKMSVMLTNQYGKKSYFVSQLEAAKYLGVSRSRISEAVSGKTTIVADHLASKCHENLIHQSSSSLSPKPVSLTQKTSQQDKKKRKRSQDNNLSKPNTQKQKKISDRTSSSSKKNGQQGKTDECPKTDEQRLPLEPCYQFIDPSSVFDMQFSNVNQRVHSTSANRRNRSIGGFDIEPLSFARCNGCGGIGKYSTVVSCDRNKSESIEQQKISILDSDHSESHSMPGWALRRDKRLFACPGNYGNNKCTSLYHPQCYGIALSLAPAPSLSSSSTSSSSSSSLSSSSSSSSNCSICLLSSRKSSTQPTSENTLDKESRDDNNDNNVGEEEDLGELIKHWQYNSRPPNINPGVFARIKQICSGTAQGLTLQRQREFLKQNGY